MVGRKSQKKRQKQKMLYKMKGCNRTNRKQSGRGYSNSLAYSYGDLAYPNNNIYRGSNSNLAYTGGNTSSAYPNTGVNGSINFINPSNQRGGNSGFVSTPWTPKIGGWPGVNPETGSGNYYKHNYYNNGDPQTAMKDVGPPPFTGGKSKRKTKRKKQKGGLFNNNSFGQDIVNLARQAQFNLGSTYNALAGYSAPVNPLPWKGQLTNVSSNVNNIRY
jgi:hypothetical protein